LLDWRKIGIIQLNNKRHCGGILLPMTLMVKIAPKCPHCDVTMVHYDLPPIAFSDGLGWGAKFLWVCPNEECPIFRKGYNHNINQYGNTASLRSIIEPDSGLASVVPTLSLDPEHFKSFVELRKVQKKNLEKADKLTEPKDTNDPYDLE